MSNTKWIHDWNYIFIHVCVCVYNKNKEKKHGFEVGRHEELEGSGTT